MQLSYEEIALVQLPGGNFPRWDSAGGNCTRREMSGGAIVLGGNCMEDNFSGGNCPGGNCPVPII